MSVISNDFASALGALRNAVNSLNATVISMQNEIDGLKKELKAAQSDSFENVNAAVLRAAAMGDQDQLEALKMQPLNSRQAEMVRLSLAPEPVQPEFHIDPEMLARLQQSKYVDNIPPIVLTAPQQASTAADSIARAHNQLQHNSATAKPERANREYINQQVEMASRSTQNRNRRNAIGPIFQSDLSDF